MKEYQGCSFGDFANLFFQFSKLNLKTTLEYKFDRTFVAVAIFCREMIAIVVMFLILIRFDHIKGWELNQLFFLYSFLFLSYSLFVFFFSGIRDLDDMVYSGLFDRFLLRPVGLMFQIISARVDFPATIGHGVVGLILILKTANSVGIDWNLQNIIYYIVVLISGAIIQASIFMISSCFSFWAIRTTNLRNMMFFNARRFAGYPISFYPGFIQKLLIFILPFAFVNYFPALYFLKKPEMAHFWNGCLYFAPVVAVITFLLVYAFWKKGLRAYSSTGNPMY